MVCRKVLLLIGLHACLLLPAWGANALGSDAPGNPEYVLKFWRTEDGLPQNSITAITQTSDAYIWFGTRNGLVRFDGVRFRVFNTVNSPEMGWSEVTALAEDSTGRLWIGLGDGGLAVREEGRMRRLPGREDAAGGVVRCLLEHRGTLWVGTDRGLMVLREGEMEPAAVPGEVGEAAITTLEAGPDGSLWVGTKIGLFRQSGDDFEPMAPRNQPIGAVVASTDGTIWIGGPNFGLLELRSEEQAPRRVWAVNEFAALGRSSGGGLWVLKPDGAVERFGAASATAVPLGVRVEGVTKLFEDREGNLWVGTEGQGLAQVRRRRLVLQTVGEPGGGVLSVTEGARGDLWLAADSGRVFRVGAEGIQPFPALDEATGGFCEALWANRGGGLWLGTRLNGVLYWDGSEPVKTRQVTAATGIRALYEDRHGRLWVASDGDGVLICHDGGMETVRGPGGEPIQEVTCFAEGSDGRVWIGTRRGLVEWSRHAVRSFEGAAGVAGAEIRSLYHDLEGSLWMGTTRGLGLFRNDRFFAVTSRDGLYDDVVHQILEDFRSQLWLGSNRGIFQVARDELQDFFAGRVSAVQSVPYGTGEGFSNPEGVGGRQPTAWRSADGKLWFGTSAGLAGLDPVRPGQNGRTPPVVIEEVLLEEGEAIRTAAQEGNVVIPPGYGRMQIRFTALSFVAPERTQFRYRLAGFEEEWRQAGVGRLATYAQLPAGEYEFQVLARNEEGGWENSEGRLALAISPRYWETAWFRALMGLAVAGGAGFVWLAHSARAREVKILRQQITRDLHDDMGSNLGSIALLSEALRKGARTGTAQMEEVAGEINRIARETLAAMGEAVWFVDPEKDSSADLLTHLRKIAATMLRDIPHRFVAPEKAGQFRLALDRKRAVVLIFKEALHNIVKHSGATEVEIEVVLARNALYLRIRDNGKGFDPDGAGTGHGLRNMRQRAEKLRAQWTLESAPGGGTELHLSLNCA